MKRIDAAGFTLVELMIALVLTGMIMLLLFGSLRVSSRGWDAAEQRQQQISEQYQLQQFLRRLIGQARGERIRDIDGVIQVTFRGEPDQLVFAAPQFSMSSEGGLLWYRLYLSEATDERPQALMLQTRTFAEQEGVDWLSLFDPDFVTRLDDEDKGIQPPEEHLLRITGDASLSFKYSFFDSDGSEEESDQWLDETRLPTLVELTLEEFDSEHEEEQAETPLLSSWQPLSVALQEYNYAVRTD
ncbi:prepilin-type N-terminal cleavage/methylation domain-containing protein [Marinobacterium mangrovicola]|uniref:Prepilin-type N-terminal cleavage/methylation domain-containing protein n=1 Tax=Marinobacterium mangrovicola TaxID=1476959 RepID=A0A4R1GP72_9GAMM|nr:prepilin-type N-terminal cleavage/methylation domain-containing protein [Marinobacterium mangrovicola]TCK08765.1 prepilin-type N-terminal cleavage/methylation domain-containing protein [Marinobacterium mangrovicola]